MKIKECCQRNPFKSYFKGWLIIRQLEFIKMISSLYLLSGRYFRLNFIITMLYPPADAHFGLNQAFEMDLFTKIVNSLKWTCLTISEENSWHFLWVGGWKYILGGWVGLARYFLWVRAGWMGVGWGISWVDGAGWICFMGRWESMGVSGGSYLF